MSKVAAIVPAAGIGRRFGEGENKPLYELCGKPLVVWALQELQSVEEISEIVLVVKDSDMNAAAGLVKDYKIGKVRSIVPGGKERQDSVYNGINALDKDAGIVVIHDGARPLVDAAIVRKSISELPGVDGVVAAVPVKDTIKEVESTDKLIVRRTLDRKVLWAIQTPQAFYYGKIADAHRKALIEGFYATDDAALIEHYGGRIRIIEGHYSNLKVTTMEDIRIAEILCREKRSKTLTTEDAEKYFFK